MLEILESSMLDYNIRAYEVQKLPSRRFENKFCNRCGRKVTDVPEEKRDPKSHRPSKNSKLGCLLNVVKRIANSRRKGKATRNPERSY